MVFCQLVWLERIFYFLWNSAIKKNLKVSTPSCIFFFVNKFVSVLTADIIFKHPRTIDSEWLTHINKRCHINLYCMTHITPCRLRCCYYTYFKLYTKCTDVQTPCAAISCVSSFLEDKFIITLITLSNSSNSVLLLLLCYSYF